MSNVEVESKILDIDISEQGTYEPITLKQGTDCAYKIVLNIFKDGVEYPLPTSTYVKYMLIGKRVDGKPIIHDDGVVSGNTVTFNNINLYMTCLVGQYTLNLAVQDETSLLNVYVNDIIINIDKNPFYTSGIVQTDEYSTLLSRIAYLNEVISEVSNVSNADNITQAGIALDARQNNPNVSGSLAKRIADMNNVGVAGSLAKQIVDMNDGSINGSLQNQIRHMNDYMVGLITDCNSPNSVLGYCDQFTLNTPRQQGLTDATTGRCMSVFTGDNAYNSQLYIASGVGGVFNRYRQDGVGWSDWQGDSTRITERIIYNGVTFTFTKYQGVVYVSDNSERFTNQISMGWNNYVATITNRNLIPSDNKFMFFNLVSGGSFTLLVLRDGGISVHAKETIPAGTHIQSSACYLI